MVKGREKVLCPKYNLKTIEFFIYTRESRFKTYESKNMKKHGLPFNYIKLNTKMEIFW
jgi:hypothetical protein